MTNANFTNMLFFIFDRNIIYVIESFFVKKFCVRDSHP